ncbi:hypothetical protein [Bythopirellula polymerisocia]|nr:hypothetical protein [Bythopirellula polymerisocia]
MNLLLGHLLPLYRILSVKPDTEIVIEGYPRCANSFAVVAFVQSQPRVVKIAHHLHSLGQVRHGLQRGIPCLILLRNPRDAVLSLVIRKNLNDMALPLREYIDFHKGILELCDKVVIAGFAQVTGDFGAVIRRVNRRYGVNFAEFDHTDENVAACYQELDRIERGFSPNDSVRSTHVARPSEDRAALKKDLEAQLLSGKAHSLLQDATALYEAILPHTLDSDEK